MFFRHVINVILESGVDFSFIMQFPSSMQNSQNEINMQNAFDDLDAFDDLAVTVRHSLPFDCANCSINSLNS